MRRRKNNIEFEKLPVDYKQARPAFIDDVKSYEGVKYYRVHFENESVDPVYMHEEQGIDLTYVLKEFRKKPLHDKSIGPMEWEVQSIEDSRVVDDETEYLVRWKYWIGDPSWLRESDCDCQNLIAAFENPKLNRIFSFNANNTRLWVDETQMDFFVRKIVWSSAYKPNILKSKIESSCSDWIEDIQDGLNLGCLMHERHWYVIFILRNHIAVTNLILALDSLNTMIAPNLTHHPIFVRLRQVFPRYTIRPSRMTQMDRSDMCAFYSLAAIERGLFLLNPGAKFVCESILFHPVRAEYIRSLVAPETNGELTVSLKSQVFSCLFCEFCREVFEESLSLDTHISKKHFRSPFKPKFLSQKLLAESSVNNVDKRFSSPLVASS